MAQILRWGLLSTAKINRALIPPLRSSKRSQLTAIASRSIDTANAYAQEQGIPRSFGSYEAMLADPDIDVVYIPLPNHLHAEWAIKAMQAGKHVLLEKPFALTVAEVRAVAEAAQQTGRIVAEAFMYRHHPQTLKVQQLVDEGALGEIKMVTGYFTFNLGRPENFRWDPQLGGGSLWDGGCYPISFVRMLTGRPPIQVNGWQTLTPQGADVNFSAQMTYEGGVFAHVYSSFDMPLRDYMEIRGSEASLFVPQTFVPRNPRTPIVLLTKENREYRFTFRKIDLYLGEVQDMEAAILDGKSPRISLQESEDNIATITALYHSARHAAQPQD